MPQEPVDKAVKEFRKWLKGGVVAGGGHSEHSQWLWYCEYELVTLNNIIYFAFTCTFLKCQTTASFLRRGIL